MLHLDFKIVDLPYLQGFETSHETKSHQKNLYVELGYGPMRGYGACPVISYARYDEQDWLQKLTAKGDMIRRYAYNGPERFWHFLHHLFPGDSYLISALDSASWDLWGHMRQSSVRDLMGLPPNTATPTDFTIGISDDTCAQMKSLDYDYLKIKWESDDLEALYKLSSCTDARLRIDLNEAWSVDTAQLFLCGEGAHRYDILEQPCDTNVDTDYRALTNPHNIYIIADESFQGLDDLKHCAERFHGINVKLPKCGGLTPAVEIILEARALGLRLLLGNMSEGILGTAALVQISSAFDDLDLDGPLLLSDDTATGLKYTDDVAQVEGPHGLGIAVNW